MTVLSNIITPSNVLTTTNTATVTNKTLTSPTVTGMTVSDGTANGVTYLNGSKVLTSGSALTFDGTNFAVVGGNATINRSTNTSRLTLGGSPSANWEGDIQFVTSNTQTNWRVSSNQVASGAFTITPSTAGGGSTFTSPAVLIDSSSNVGIGTTSPAQKLHCLADTSSALFQGGTLGGITFLKTGQTGMQLFSDATGTLKIYDNNAGAAVLAMVNQNLGIGTTSPSNRVSIVTASGSDGIVSVKSPLTETAGVVIDGGTSSNKGSVLKFSKDATVKWQMGTDSAIIGGTTDNFHLYGGGANAILFSTNATERARIDSSGNLLVGTTSLVSAGKIEVATSAATNQGLNIKDTSGSNNLTYCAFFNSSGTVAGTITHTGSTTVAYNTSSDYRLKENIAPMTGALNTVAQLKPVTYKWKEDQTAGQGFIAHELQAVVPDCVTGAKDALDEDGKPVYQGIDTSFLVATLTSALQELNAKFEAYVASHP